MEKRWGFVFGKNMPRRGFDRVNIMQSDRKKSEREYATTKRAVQYVAIAEEIVPNGSNMPALLIGVLYTPSPNQVHTLSGTF